MLSVLAAGTLVRDPQSRQGSSGRSFASAAMRVGVEGADAVLVSLVAFRSSAIDALTALTKGDALAVTGRAKLTSWEKDGEQHHGLSVVAEHVMTPYQIEKRRKASEPKCAEHE